MLIIVDEKRKKEEKLLFWEWKLGGEEFDYFLLEVGLLLIIYFWNLRVSKLVSRRRHKTLHFFPLFEIYLIDREEFFSLLLSIESVGVFHIPE